MTMFARLISLFIALFMLGGAASAQGAPASDLMEQWTANNPDSTQVIDHSVWKKFLLRHIRLGPDSITRIDYGCVQPSEHASLKGYIRTLIQVPVSSLNRDEQFAYWVNLYNALTIDVVLQHYPVASIRDIQLTTGTGGFFTGLFGGLINPGPWGEPLVTVEGTPLSLDDIEHRILRPIWKNPKTHFALNCAAIGCPNLQGAFTAKNTSTLLHKGAWDYINHPRGVRAGTNGVMVSDLFIWYQDDFAPNQGKGLVRFLKTYAQPDLSKALTSATKSGKALQGMGYDWALNDAACGAY